MKTDEELLTDARYLIAHPLMHFSTPEAREMLAACIRKIDQAQVCENALKQNFKGRHLYCVGCDHRKECMKNLGCLNLPIVSGISTIEPVRGETIVTVDYQNIDDKIIAAVRAGKTTFIDIRRWLGKIDFRVLGGRLQAIRKRGLLTYTRETGWTCVEKSNG